NIEEFEAELKANKEEEGNISFHKFNDKIELKNISFRYGEKSVLNNISFTIHQNETIAFVGESGSGKTTIINLIISLLTPNKGNILIGGVDSGTIQKESYRRRIGYICQDPVIFNDTIFNNVTMWDSPTEANHIRFKKVMEQTSLTKFIAELSAQENTL